MWSCGWPSCGIGPCGRCWRQRLRASLVTHFRRGSDLARRPVKSPAKEGSGCLVRLFLIPPEIDAMGLFDRLKALRSSRNGSRGDRSSASQRTVAAHLHGGDEDLEVVGEASYQDALWDRARLRHDVARIARTFADRFVTRAVPIPPSGTVPALVIVR